MATAGGEVGFRAMLRRDQIEEYFERGFTIAEGVLDDAMLSRARAIIDGIVANARSVTRNNEVYDLEETSAGEQALLRDFPRSLLMAPTLAQGEGGKSSR
jgi:hypothetical protein